MNAASNLAGAIAPGEIVVLYGSNLGPSSLAVASVSGDGYFDASLAGSSVTFNGIPAPLLYTSAGQVAAIVPYAVSGGTAQIVVSFQGQKSPVFSVPVADAAPGIFTSDSSGQGQAACLNQDYSVNSPSTPAHAGDYIVLFATGEGLTTPPGADGKPASDPLPKPNLAIAVTIGSQAVTPVYAGGAPGEVAGVLQINVQIPSGTVGNAVPVSIRAGPQSSRTGVTIAVR